MLQMSLRMLRLLFWVRMLPSAAGSVPGNRSTAPDRSLLMIALLHDRYCCQRDLCQKRRKKLQSVVSTESNCASVASSLTPEDSHPGFGPQSLFPASKRPVI